LPRDRESISNDQWQAALRLFNYHRLSTPLRHCAAAIVLGCHDLGVARHAADLYHGGWFPVMVCSGAVKPNRPEGFPHGEAVRFRDEAVAAGVPPSAVLREPAATNTGLNITLSRAVLAAAGIRPRSVMLVCRPYNERRAWATCRKQWPDVDVVCASQPIGFDDYLDTIGDDRHVINILVGDLQRIAEYPARGHTVAQDIPPDVHDAYQRLRRDGFVGRLIPAQTGK
jgi:uncharacterized SAM-binding protein YcdF (DUF218 family)